MRIPKRLVSLLVPAVLLAGCGNGLSSVTGTLDYKTYGGAERCNDAVGSTGTLKSGVGEILGTIEIEKVDPTGTDKWGNALCTATLFASDIDLDVNVLVVDFTESYTGASGHWILNKSDFENGEIGLTTL